MNEYLACIKMNENGQQYCYLYFKLKNGLNRVYLRTILVLEHLITILITI